MLELSDEQTKHNGWIPLSQRWYSSKEI